MIKKLTAGIFPCQLKKNVFNMKIGTHGFVQPIINEKSVIWNGEKTTFDFIFSVNQDFEGVVFFVMLAEISFN
ncbi:hypothetical protein [Emticicia oligotrophica]|nr:hypothetical protein [Emticicia oligotrophica]